MAAKKNPGCRHELIERKKKEKKLDQILLSACQGDRSVLEESLQSDCKMVINVLISCTYSKNVYYNDVVDVYLISYIYFRPKLFVVNIDLCWCITCTRTSESSL